VQSILDCLGLNLVEAKLALAVSVIPNIPGLIAYHKASRKSKCNSAAALWASSGLGLWLVYFSSGLCGQII